MFYISCERNKARNPSFSLSHVKMPVQTFSEFSGVRPWKMQNDAPQVSLSETLDGAYIQGETIVAGPFVHQQTKTSTLGRHNEREGGKELVAAKLPQRDSVFAIAIAIYTSHLNPSKPLSLFPSFWSTKHAQISPHPRRPASNARLITTSLIHDISRIKVHRQSTKRRITSRQQSERLGTVTTSHRQTIHSLPQRMRAASKPIYGA